MTRAEAQHALDALLGSYVLRVQASSPAARPARSPPSSRRGAAARMRPTEADALTRLVARVHAERVLLVLGHRRAERAPGVR